MKSIIHKAIYWALPLLTLPTTGLLLQSCEEDKAEKWVDLRYRVEDSYVIQASNPEPFSFEVKSTDSWEVFVGAEVEDIPTLRSQITYQKFFHFIARMVAGDTDFLFHNVFVFS